MKDRERLSGTLLRGQRVDTRAIDISVTGRVSVSCKLDHRGDRAVLIGRWINR